MIMKEVIRMYCQICGALLRPDEDTICDDCFKLEREDNPPLDR